MTGEGVPRMLAATVAYDGTPFVGWERQKNGLGIQEVLEEAIRVITGESVIVEASGRTDAGVHALGQVVSFPLCKAIHPAKLVMAMNAVLPPEVAILDVREETPTFHARRSARRKTYRYTILNQRARLPAHRFTAFHVPQALDIASMGRAARYLVGTHDFRAFSREPERKRSTVRTILRLEITEAAPLLFMEVEGTGFLYNMVRIIAGTLLEVGRGRRTPESVEAALRSKMRPDAGYTVPPHGLALVSVAYEEPSTGRDGCPI